MRAAAGTGTACVRPGAASSFLASGYPRPAPGIPKERNLQGISFAVANMSGFAARALESLEERSLENLQGALIGQAGE